MKSCRPIAKFSEHSIRWMTLNLIGFDKYRKIAYGYRSTNQRWLDLVKFQIFTSHEQVIEKLRFHYPQDLNVCNYFAITMNSDGDTIGICQTVSNGFLVDEPYSKCCCILHMFCLETEVINTYYITGQFESEELEENENENFSLGDYKILHSNYFGWILIGTNAGFHQRISKYWCLNLNEGTKDGFLEYVTSFSYSIRPYDLVSNDSLACVSADFTVLHVYDLCSNMWSKQTLYDVPVGEHCQLLGVDINCLYIWSASELFRLDEENMTWTAELNKSLSQFLSIEDCITSEELLFFKHVDYYVAEYDLCNDLDFGDDDEDSEEDNFNETSHLNNAYFVGYHLKMLSLRDMCMLEIGKGIHPLFLNYSEEEICNLLQLPPTLIRQYFGQKWSLTNKVQYTNIDVVLSPLIDNSDDDTDDFDGISSGF